MAVTVIILFVIFLVSKQYYFDQFEAVRSLGINFLPPADVFRFFWFLFIIIACVGYFIASETSLIRWTILIFLTLITALLLFNDSRFSYWSFALLTLFAIMIVLGESIYYYGVVLENKLVAALFGFYFLWSIYGIFLISSVLLKISARENLIIDARLF